MKKTPSISTGKSKRLFFLSMLVATVGCTRSPVVNYYVLTASYTPNTAASEVAPGTKIAVELPGMPAVVNRGEIVEFLDEIRVRVLEDERWASDIDENVRDALLTGLRSHAYGRYLAYKRHPGTRSDVMLMTDVARFELRSPGSAILQVTWRVADWDGNILLGPHDEFIERAHPPNDIAAGVAALSASIDELAQRIAAHLGSKKRFQ